eukprot:3407871-Prymnesium_polylepis.1
MSMSMPRRLTSGTNPHPSPSEVMPMPSRSMDRLSCTFSSAMPHPASWNVRRTIARWTCGWEWLWKRWRRTRGASPLRAGSTWSDVGVDTPPGGAPRSGAPRLNGVMPLPSSR